MNKNILGLRRYCETSHNYKLPHLRIQFDTRQNFAKHECLVLGVLCDSRLRFCQPSTYFISCPCSTNVAVYVLYVYILSLSDWLNGCPMLFKKPFCPALIYLSNSSKYKCKCTRKLL